MLSDKLQRVLILDALHESGLASSDQELPATVRVKHGTNGAGKRIHYYLNYSSAPASFRYDYRAGCDLLTGDAKASGATVQVAAWDLVIVEEDK